MALVLPDPQEGESVFAHGWVSFIGWTAGGAVALAYVVRPVLALACAIFAPHIVIPDVPLSAMWPPVLAILGAGGTRVAGNFVRLREARKTQEMTLKVCADCPTRNCEACPLRALASDAIHGSPPSPRDPTTTDLPAKSSLEEMLGFPNGFAPLGPSQSQRQNDPASEAQSRPHLQSEQTPPAPRAPDSLAPLTA
jgi:hypothetical protein